MAWFLAGAALVIVLSVGTALAALTTGDDPRPRPTAARNTPQPVVPEDPATTIGPAATAVRSTASTQPSAVRSSSPARPTSAAPTTPGPPRVVSVTVSADPDEFPSCRGSMITRITVRMTLSQPGLPVRYTINESSTVRDTASSTTFVKTTQANVSPIRGDHQVRIAVTQPSTASTSTTISVDCGR
ncbi:hypothetical protein Dvina_42955 [Dactylosporangium vinaceum]|uniref:Uncharacterized protein n=1 Tax=Dactylosporangium vinaceum TaxID=53362 RepID=A0ABV5MHD0_9ACTN|nr:hypothetical protein [Dactylosporangium vinaceum]UAB94796.1 hypothetical protein Dvina_42955 [Dactylosporangium vinaceum]